MSVPEQIVHYRKKKNLNQFGLANLLGCTKFMICHIEKGRRLPGRKLAMKIKLVTGIDCVCPTCGKYFDREDSLEFRPEPEPEVHIVS